MDIAILAVSSPADRLYLARDSAHFISACYVYWDT